jgi:hypothetical protein
VRDSTEFSSSITPLYKCSPCTWIGGVVVGRYTLAYRPCVHPARERRQCSSIAVSAQVVYRSVVGTVRLDDRYVFAGITYLLSWCIGINGVGISSR